MTELNDSKATIGVVVPVVTPVTVQETIDESAYRAAIKRCLNAGVHGIFAGGSAGMGPLLTDRQWYHAMEIARDEVGDDHLLMGGIIATSTARALEQIRVLEQLNYTMMVVTPTFYIKPSSNREMLAHFSACRDATNMQMVVYNIPSCTGSSVSIDVIEDMAWRGWMKLIKESSGDRDYFATVYHRTRDMSIDVLQGNEPDIEWGLKLGAAGIVPVSANYEPQTFVTAIQAIRDDNPELLSKAQHRISALRDILGVSRKNWISGIMYAMKTLGIGTGIPLKPLQELTPEEKIPLDELKVLDSICSMENL